MRQENVVHRGYALTGLPLFPDLGAAESDGMIERLRVFAAGIHRGLKVAVRPMPHHQPRQLIDAPLPGPLTPVAELIPNVLLERLERFVGHG